MNRSQPDKEVVTERRKAIRGIETWNIMMEHKGRGRKLWKIGQQEKVHFDQEENRFS